MPIASFRVGLKPLMNFAWHKKERRHNSVTLVDVYSAIDDLRQYSGGSTTKHNDNEVHRVSIYEAE